MRRNHVYFGGHLKKFAEITPSYKKVLHSIHRGGFKSYNELANKVKFETPSGGYHRLQKQFWFYRLDRTENKGDMEKFHLVPGCSLALPQLEIVEYGLFDKTTGLITAGPKRPLTVEEEKALVFGDHIRDITLSVNQYIETETGELVHSLEEFLHHTVLRDPEIQGSVHYSRGKNNKYVAEFITPPSWIPQQVGNETILVSGGQVKLSFVHS